MQNATQAPEFWDEREVATIRSMAMYWREIRERGDASFAECADHEAVQVRQMIRYSDRLLRMAEYCADPVRRAAPMLLEALQECFDVLDAELENDPEASLIAAAVTHARAAIAASE